MDSNKNCQTGMFEIRFVDQEVSVIREAFRAHNAYINDRGNEASSYSKHVASWTGQEQRYVGGTLEHLQNSLRYYEEITEEQVDKALDLCPDDTRLFIAAMRYRFGRHAGVLLEQIDTFAEANEAAEE